MKSRLYSFLPLIMIGLILSACVSSTWNERYGIENSDISSPSSVQALIKALSDTDYMVRWNAAVALGDIGPDAKAAVPAIVQALSDSNGKVQSGAAYALGRIGPDAIPALIQALSNSNDKVRSIAAHALGLIGPDAAAAVPALVQALSDNNEKVRRRAAEALSKIGSDATKAAIPVLIQNLSNNDWSVRYDATWALGKIGPDAKAAVPALILSITDEDEVINKRIIEALNRIGPPNQDIIHQLIQLLAHKNNTIRLLAVKTLSQKPIRTEQEKRAFMSVLEDPEPELRKMAIETLLSNKYDGSDFYQALMNLSENDPDNAVKKSAQNALQKLRFTAIASGKPIKLDSAKPVIVKPAQIDKRSSKETIQQFKTDQTAGTNQPIKEKRIALVIGNAAYKVAPLINPVNDSLDMALSLEQLGFEVIHKKNENQRSMESAIYAFSKRLRKGGVGLFYYAGHGVQINGRNYLIPIDANINTEFDVKYEAVDAGRVLDGMNDAGNGLNIVLLDACRDNPFARSFRSSSRGLARMDAPTGTFIAYATAPGSIAADGQGRNGIFTKHLLKNIMTPGLDLERVLKRTRVSVMQETNSKQVPWQSSSLTGDFYFIP